MTFLPRYLIALPVVAVAVSSHGAQVNRGPGPQPQRLWLADQPTGFGSSVSPDGRFLAWISNKTGDLAIRDLSAGTSRLLTHDAAYDKVPNQWAESPVFSPDGRTIAYSWYNNRTGTELRLVDVDGLRIRTIAWLPDTDPTAEAWTPDGRFVAVTLDRPDRSRQLALVPAGGGAPRVLKTFTEWAAPQPGHMRISPDGRYIAYAFTTPKGEGAAEIRVLSLETGNESVVMKSAPHTFPVGWSSDGTHLLMASDRQGSPGLWMVGVASGRNAGTPELTRGELWGMRSGGSVASDGRYYYWSAAGDLDLFTARFDPVNGKLESPPVSLTGHPGERTIGHAWSPDGKYVAYVSNTVEGHFAGSTIVIRSVDGGESRELHPKVAELRTFQWIPGASALLIWARDDKGRPALMRLDLKSGDVQTVVTADLAPGFSVSADGRTVYYSTPYSSPADSARIIAHDLSTGREHQLLSGAKPTSLGTGRLLRDGRSMLASQFKGDGMGHRNLVLTIATGAVREIGTELPRDSGYREDRSFLVLAPDERSFIVLVRRPPAKTPGSTEDVQVWRVFLDGSPSQHVGPWDPQSDWSLLARNPQGLSADERRIVFSKGKLEAEFWSLDVPALRADPKSSPKP